METIENTNCAQEDGNGQRRFGSVHSGTERVEPENPDAGERSEPLPVLLVGGEWPTEDLVGER